MEPRRVSSVSRLLVVAVGIASLSGCRGAVTARGMKALGRWSDRPVALEGAQPGEPEEVAWARIGAVEGLEKAGLAFTKEPVPGALVIRVRKLEESEGRDTLLSAPQKFAARAAMGVVGEAAHVAGQAKAAPVRGAGAVVGTGLAVVGGVEAVREGSRVRMALELGAPEVAAPVGGVVWEGYRNLNRNGAAEQAGREAAEILAEEIASQRDRWVDRRPASERLFMTPTPHLLEKGEAVVSLDQALLLHAGFGVNRWLQLDAVGGGWIVPRADGLVHSHRDGWALLGAAGIGAKVRVAEETERLPGISLSYDRLWLWSGAIGTGRIVLLDSVVDTASPDASSGVGLNVLTLAVAKNFAHPKHGDVLQAGAGALLVDNHPLLGSGTPVVEVDGTERSERLPTAVLPYVNAEFRLGEHARFISEYLFRGGLSLGFRWLLFGSRKFEHVGGIRTAGWKLRLDTAAVVTTRDVDRGVPLAVLPWIGVAFYPR